MPPYSEERVEAMSFTFLDDWAALLATLKLEAAEDSIEVAAAYMQSLGYATPRHAHGVSEAKAGPRARGTKWPEEPVVRALLREALLALHVGLRQEAEQQAQIKEPQEASAEVNQLQSIPINYNQFLGLECVG